MNAALIQALVTGAGELVGLAGRMLNAAQNDDEGEARRLLEEARGRYGDARQGWRDRPGPADGVEG